MVNSEENLIADILDGDVDAYAILVKRYQTPIFNLMMRIASSEQDALDLTQETFLRAYENLERFKPSARFFPWLYTIGINLGRDFLRKTKMRETKAEELYQTQRNLSLEAELKASSFDTLELSRVREAVQELSLEYREALILRFHEGLSMRDIALALGTSVSGAKMRVHRGLLKLRQFLISGESDVTRESSRQSAQN